MPGRKRVAPAALYRRIFEDLPLGIKVWRLEDPDDPGSLRLLASNAAASEATGVPADLVLGKTIAEAFPEAVPRGLAAAFAEVALSGRARNLGEMVYGDARMSEGVYSVFAFPLPDRSLGVAFENITRRKLGESARERQAGLARLTCRIVEAVNASESSTEALRRCLTELCVYARWPLGHVLQRRLGEDEMVSAKIWYMDDPARFAAFRDVSEPLRYRKGVGLPGRVWEAARPSWVIDVAADDTLFPSANLLPDIGLKGAVGFPVLVSGEVLAVLEFFSPESRVPDYDLLRVMESLGQQLGFAVRREGGSP